MYDIRAIHNILDIILCIILSISLYNMTFITHILYKIIKSDVRNLIAYNIYKAINLYISSISDLNKLKIHPLYHYDKTIDCTICLEKLSDDVSSTLCGHLFHTKCIGNIKTNKCPVCRKLVIIK